MPAVSVTSAPKREEQEFIAVHPQAFILKRGPASVSLNGESGFMEIQQE